MAAFNLPYFDQIIAAVDRRPDSALAEAFKRHVHWGCFDQPETADDSLNSYVVAAEELTRRICAAGGVADGRRILDVGCGFGGTIEHLNQRLSNCEFVGLNIDARQLARARQLIVPRAGNRVSFVEADACDLPFDDGRFDVALAVECVFHFRSRKQFFREIRRVLKPGGSLALSDFVRSEGSVTTLGAWMQSGDVPENGFYGSNAKSLTSAGYARLAQGSGFARLVDDDITANTLPTYPSLRRLYREAGLSDGEQATAYLEETARRGFVQYHILACSVREEA